MSEPTHHEPQPDRCLTGHGSVYPCIITDGVPGPLGHIVGGPGGIERSRPACASHLAELLLRWDPGSEPEVTSDLPPAEDYARADLAYGIASHVAETLWYVYDDEEEIRTSTPLGPDQWQGAIDSASNLPTGTV
ncbi:hypothetical protein OG948_60585 (plasmid) [Embleya sp. NBC_00888]|uniref:hypothetical protein n=1 Tax=Embleya sp. NBC_00888 TaxID=2975960 RepID=UPI002F918142|nr:hypothetical protein OG948_60585 [Embleya sp. NBC_00888]